MDYYQYRCQMRDAHGSDRIIADAVLWGGLLAQQYWCDQWIKIENNRLRWMRLNQTKLKTELYQGLMDAVAANDVRAAGSFTILASSFIGSPRAQHASYQDAMAITRQFGKADLFITMTCNPKWEEIITECADQPAWARPDITCRVFKMKLDALLNDLVKDGILGKVIAHIYVIEFQKRGLPHAHILLIFADEDKLRSADQYDKLICAEIPNKDTHPRLHTIVVGNMLHGPCGDTNPAEKRCQDNGCCSKNFPKRFCSETTDKHDSFPEYRRRSPEEGGESYEVLDRDGAVKWTMDNRWVVPYCPYLSLRYNCHINVEICNSIQSIKYLYKYVYKGPDKIAVAIVPQNAAAGSGFGGGRGARGDRGGRGRGGGGGGGGRDSGGGGGLGNGGAGREHAGRQELDPTEPVVINEIDKYIDCRYMGACNAVWRILGFEMGQNYPAVYRLQLHLPNMQQVQYQEGSEEQALLDARATPTQLTAYFKAVAEERLHPLTETQRGKDTHGHFHPCACDLTYDRFSSFYTWQSTKHKWQRRAHGKRGDTICRMYTAAAKSGELFYERMLLCKQKGVASFDELKTVDSFVHTTFKEACCALGLLKDDAEWTEYLEELASVSMPSEIRRHFVRLLDCNNPSNPVALYERFKDKMSEDFMHQRNSAMHLDDRTITTEDHSQCLYAMQAALMELSDGKKSLWSGVKKSETSSIDVDHFNFPSPQHALRAIDVAINPALRDELAYNREDQRQKYDDFRSTANTDQIAAEEAIFAAFHSDSENKCFFVDAPGGTGKTRLFNTILTRGRSEVKICIAMSSSGISAILLLGGLTAHSRCKLPLEINENSTLRITRQSHLGQLLAAADIIIWDEAAMSSRHNFEALDRLLRELMGRPDSPFGGKVFVAGGDFRQVLPVVPRENRAGVVSKSFKRSPLWQNFKSPGHTLNLTINERVRRNGDDAEARSFCEFLLDIGEDKIPHRDDLGGVDSDLIQIPEDYVFKGTVEDLIDWCYPELKTPGHPDTSLSKAILTAHNVDVDKLNEIALMKMTGDVISLPSADCVHDDGESTGPSGNLYTTEFLNSLNVSGLPPHDLRVKIGAPVVLLRNLDPKKGLCNGTRLIVLAATRRLLTCKIESGPRAGDIAYLPRIDLVPSNASSLPCQLERRQFPVRLAYAMSINKAQGQSLQRVGVFLAKPVFSHGQLYVALSRSGVPSHTKILIVDMDGKQGRFAGHDGTFTKNIVYREIL